MGDAFTDSARCDTCRKAWYYCSCELVISEGRERAIKKAIEHLEAYKRAGGMNAHVESALKVLKNSCT